MAMGDYAILHINKIKSTKGLTQASNHNFRKVLASNIDVDRIDDNRQLKGESGESYARIFKEAVKESPYYKNHEVAKNAVMGYEVLLTLSREMRDKVDFDRWCDENVKWLEKEFGEANVKNVVLHLDEETPHIHAFIVPMNEKGRLSSTEFIDGKKDLTRLQDSYADCMAALGLNRGIRKSRAKREDIKKFYQRIDDALKYSEQVKEFAGQREDETEEECIERLTSSISDMAMEIKRTREENEEKERKLQELSRKIEEIESLTDIVIGDDFADMIRYTLRNGSDAQAVDVLKKLIAWSAEEYRAYREEMEAHEAGEDVGEI